MRMETGQETLTQRKRKKCDETNVEAGLPASLRYHIVHFTYQICMCSSFY